MAVQIQRHDQRPEPSAVGSRPRAVSRSAACWSCGSGGASFAAIFPGTCVWA
ncbi:MAG TPA: hypothetical protein VK471_11620 [Solirubrobacterales bacterium]|nr:hypothetical protein [Solirubrobacterales bacterium]